MDLIQPHNLNVNTLFSFDTEYSADSVEWCPHEPHQNIFACANYQLTEDETSKVSPSKKRIGRILIFSISPTTGLKLHQTLDTPAVLDQKWCHNRVNNKCLLGVVNAKKKIEIYQLNEENIQLELVTDFIIDNDESETLVLSLDWSTNLIKSDEPEIVCSDSKGHVHLFKLKDDKLTLQFSYHGHYFETWITGFYYWDTNIFFSGGDDSILLKFDKRIGMEPIGKNKTHEAGVTSLHSNCSSEFILATGSYDEHVRLWDIRNIKNELNSIKMPGPLWRLKWDPFIQKYLLAASMLGGIHILDSTDKDKINIVGSYYNHKNIAYGADWCYLEQNDVSKFEDAGDCIIGTCSFYDHLLCISKVCLHNL